jgi:DNA-binding MarR family transcriptional regulator
MIVTPSTTSIVENLDVNPGYQLWLATHALQRTLNRGLDSLRLTFVQFFVLDAVSRLAVEHESVSQAQVCRFCSMDPNMISQVARTLEKKGLLVRADNPSDRRAYVLTLTAVGEILIIAAREKVKPLVESFFAPVGERQLELTDILREVMAAAEV